MHDLHLYVHDSPDWTSNATSLKFQCNSIQFYLCSTFYDKIVSRCFPEAETQGPKPPGKHSGKENSLLTGRNLEQDPAYKQEPSC